MSPVTVPQSPITPSVSAGTISQKRIEANRLNAQKSTGPKTEEGKKKSALNACRHNLTGQVTTMTDPDRAFYNVFLEGFMVDWKPRGATEIQLVTRIAHDNWRLNRASAIEDNFFAMGVGHPAVVSAEGHPEIDDSFAQARTYEQKAKTLQLLSLYEQRLTRAVHKNTELLKKMQADRLAEEAKAMEEAQQLLQLAEKRGQNYDPKSDGFLFSKEEIYAAISRERRLNHAANSDFNKWQRKNLRNASAKSAQPRQQPMAEAA
jgi:hypothetical protein